MLEAKSWLDNLEDTPDHLPDIGIFQIHNVIDGPLQVIPLRGKKWNVPNYENIDKMFKKVCDIDRKTNFSSYLVV